MYINHLPGVPGGDDDPMFNAGELTPAEIAARDAPDEEAAPAVDQAAIDAEAARAAQEAEAAEANRLAAEALATPLPPLPGDAPVAAEDFAAALAEAAEKVRSGLLDPVEYADERERIRAAEAAHNAAAADHANKVAAREAAEAAIAEASKKVESNWNADYATFAKTNAEFMANPLYVRDMQTVINDILKQDPAIDNAKLLSEAFDKVAKYHRYEKPDPGPDAIALALANRHEKPPGQNLGDMPTAMSETPTGNATYDALDKLAVEDHEATFAAMSESQQEAYLRAAPGATSTGRD